MSSGKWRSFLSLDYINWTLRNKLVKYWWKCKTISSAKRWPGEQKKNPMMTSSNGNIFRVSGHLCGEFTGHRWIHRTKASDAELWCFLSLISVWVYGWVNNREAGNLRRYRAYYDVIVMPWLFISTWYHFFVSSKNHSPGSTKWNVFCLAHGHRNIHLYACLDSAWKL